MKWTNTQYIDLMTYNNPERPMFSELFGPIIGLPEEWRRQGASEDMINLSAFSFDYVPFHYLGNFQVINGYAPVTIQDDENYYVGLDHFGRRIRLNKNTATIPLPETYPVETMDDWLKIKHMFEYDPIRITEDDIEHAKRLQKEGQVILCEICGAFDILRELMGEENCCIAYYEDPELIFDILNTISETNTRMLEMISNKMTIDMLAVHEDMAGKSGPIVGANIVNEFMKPYYRASWDIVSSAGTKLFSQDSDGNMNPVMDAFIDCGVNVFNPCEPAAGMDIVKLREKYGKKIAFHGGIDKHVLRKTKADIDAELDYKLSPEILKGGVVLGLDHRITNGTPLENYIYYVDSVRRRLGLEDFRTAPNGWGSMGI